MYESPIDLVIGEMYAKCENDCLKYVQNYGFDVNKEELEKALIYDRRQYDKGFSDGYKMAIDEFAERLKERLKGLQMVELQGKDMCPCSETGEECPYINHDVGCQYCAREQTIKDIDEIAEELRCRP